jgi:hypothetical protein
MALKEGSKVVPIVLNSQELEFLERRGAKSSRGPSSRGISNTIRRELGYLAATLAAAQVPLEPAEFSLCSGLIRDPWKVDADSIQVLPESLSHHPQLATRAASLGVDPSVFLDKLRSLTFVQRLKLIDTLQIHHGQDS